MLFISCKGDGLYSMPASADIRYPYVWIIEWHSEIYEQLINWPISFAFLISLL